MNFLEGLALLFITLKLTGFVCWVYILTHYKMAIMWNLVYFACKKIKRFK
jgi:hypothetical protein